ncbi:uncharacterized protein LOC144629175 isoform X2 [Oculina patagonica]
MSSTAAMMNPQAREKAELKTMDPAKDVKKEKEESARQQEKDAAVKENIDLQAEIKKLEIVIEQQKKKISELRDKNWKSRDAIATMERKLKVFLAAMLVLKQKDEANMKLTKELEKFKDQLKSAERFIESEKKKNSDLREKIWKKCDENNVLKKKMKITGKENEKLLSEKRELQRLKGVLQDELHQVQEANAQIKEEVKMVRRQNIKCESELTATKKELEAQKKTTIAGRLKSIYNHFTLPNIFLASIPFL